MVWLTGVCCGLSSDFECVLDRQGQPVPYTTPSRLQISEEGKVQWASSATEQERMELPTGAQRYTPYAHHYRSPEVHTL